MPVRKHAGTRPYRLEIGDEAGPYDVKYFQHFQSMLEQAQRWKKVYPRKLLVPSNSDRADYNFDGLTDEERERFWDELAKP